MVKKSCLESGSKNWLDLGESFEMMTKNIYIYCKITCGSFDEFDTMDPNERHSALKDDNLTTTVQISTWSASTLIVIRAMAIESFVKQMAGHDSHPSLPKLFLSLAPRCPLSC